MLSSSFTLSLFHTLRSFSREITCKKMKIKSGERDFALELMQKFCYAKDEETYDRLYHLLDACGMPSVKGYFDTHWADIREEWIDGLNDGAFTLGERTNNRLESINAKIKSVCTVNADIASFFDNFLAYLSSTRNERDHGTLMTIAKRRVTCENAVEKQFAAFLTPYALDKVVHQLRSVSHIEATLRSPKMNRTGEQETDMVISYMLLTPKLARATAASVFVCIFHVVTFLQSEQLRGKISSMKLAFPIAGPCAI